ncbi:MAG: hypothetical protein PHT51_03500 [Patescibacteria group bacterium]|nr:hypothetical protein [Patescibacteria group bacterium]MDD4610434.1 hypothetical protein [Patescibacteria group bacterium]
MDNKKIIAAGAVLTAVIAVMGIASITYADTGTSTLNKFIPGNWKINSEKRDAEQKAFVNNDYDAWKALVGDNPVTEKITKDNFAKFVEAHRLMSEGKFQEAKVIFDELGVNPGGGFGKMHNNRHGPRFEDKNKDGFCDYLDKQ